MTKEELDSLKPGDRVRIINQGRNNDHLHGFIKQDSRLIQTGRVYVVKKVDGFNVITTDFKLSAMDPRVPEDKVSVWIGYKMIEKVTDVR